MSDNITELLDSGGGSWNLPEDEGLRQAVPALRGYAYQLHRSLTAWLDLPDRGSLLLPQEGGEDELANLHDFVRDLSGADRNAGGFSSDTASDSAAVARGAKRR